MEMKSYYAIIPANVRYDNELTPNAKLLYGEITALCNEKGYCWANNEYFSELYNVSKVSVSKWINSLIKKGYLECDFVYKENSKEIDKRILSVVIIPLKEKFNTPLTKVKDPFKEKFNTPLKEKFKDNNTFLFNNTFNNTIKNIKKEFEEIFDFWNSKNIIVHREMPNLKCFEDALKISNVEEIKQSITNYNKILNTGDFYFKHRWTLETFLKKQKNKDNFNFKRFLDGGDMFMSFENRTIVKTPKNKMIDISKNNYDNIME